MPRLTENGQAILEATAAAILAQCAGGYFQILSGTKPAGPRAPLAGNTVLHECRLANPAGPTATVTSTGILINFAAFSTEPTRASGVATFARIYDTTKAKCLFQLTVGTAGDSPNVVLPALDIPAGVSWTPGAFSLPIPTSTAGV